MHLNKRRCTWWAVEIYARSLSESYTQKDKECLYVQWEFIRVLYLLAKSPGQVFSKEQIYNQVWKTSYYGAEDNVVIISSFRNWQKQKNPAVGVKFKYINPYIITQKLYFERERISTKVWSFYYPLVVFLKPSLISNVLENSDFCSKKVCDINVTYAGYGALCVRESLPVWEILRKPVGLI